MSDRAEGALSTELDEQVLAEHIRIKELNLRLEASSDAAELLETIAELRAFLAHHFSGESRTGGFFETLLQAAPRHRHRVDALEAEHEALLADLDALAQRATECLGAIAALHGDASAIGARLRAHEAAEEHLMIDTVCTDLGQPGG